MSFNAGNYDDRPDWMNDELLKSAQEVHMMSLVTLMAHIEVIEDDGTLDSTDERCYGLILGVQDEDSDAQEIKMFTMMTGQALHLLQAIIFLLPDGVKLQVMRDIENQWPNGVPPSPEVLIEEFKRGEQQG